MSTKQGTDTITSQSWAGSTPGIYNPVPRSAGTQPTTGLIPASAVYKVQLAYRELGFEVSQEQAQKDLVKAVNLVKLVLNHAAETGALAPYYKEASHD